MRAVREDYKRVIAWSSGLRFAMWRNTTCAFGRVFSAREHGAKRRMPLGMRPEARHQHKSSIVLSPSQKGIPMSRDPAAGMYRAAVEIGAAKSEWRLRNYIRYLFHKVDFSGRRVLDIGGGTGVFSMYAACRGAESAVCMEPECDGSTANVARAFARLQTAVPTVGERVTLERVTLQEYPAPDKPFDVVLLNNSINHLDEQACIHLLEDAANEEVYRQLLTKIHGLCAPNAVLIVADCSRYNLFPCLGLRNPLVRSIEWHKHQAPSTWVRLLRDVGFGSPVVRWSGLPPVGLADRVFCSRKPVAFMLASHFCIHMSKVAGAAHQRTANTVRRAA